MVARLRGKFSDRRLALTGSLALLSVFVLALIAFRIAHTHSWLHIELGWNLLLAWIPFAISLAVYDRAQRGATIVPVVGGFLWLLFLPNAPYLVTDLKYVDGGSGIPALYDVLLFAAAAFAGLVLGLTSLLLMHAVARRVIGAARAWGCVAAALVLSSIGIYLGRFQRWNSWDVFVRPGSLVGDVARAVIDPLSHPKPLAVIVLFTCFLSACYLVFYAFAATSSLLSE